MRPLLPGKALRRSIAALALALLLPFATAADAAAEAASSAASGASAPASNPKPSPDPKREAEKPAGKAPDTGSAPGNANCPAGSTKPECVTPDYGAAGKVLFTAFALALFLESALALLFNWRPFVQRFVRGTRTIVSFVVSLALVASSKDLRLFDNLVVALYPNNHEPLGPLGQLLSAMLLAGGSAGINNLLVTLGFRSARTPESVAPRPAPTMAWVAVRVTDPANKPADRLLVMMEVNESKTWQVIGTIEGRSNRVRYFVADSGRFPTSGGHAVKGGQTYAFKVTGTDGNVRGTPAQWGPLAIEAGAIVDIDFAV